MALLGGLQLVAAIRPRAEWTIDNVYGGSPDATDPRAYFAFNQGSAWADPFFWAPLQFAGSIGMVLGEPAQEAIVPASIECLGCRGNVLAAILEHCGNGGGVDGLGLDGLRQLLRDSTILPVLDEE